MGTMIDYRQTFNRSKATTAARSGEGEPTPPRLRYVRTWRRAVEARKPKHRRTNRWWW
jgi:hypothetical protein